jgi:hypothetical protein
VGPRGREAEMVREPAHQGPVRPVPAEPRVGQRRRRDDVGVGPAHEPQEEAGGMLEDLRRHFERVLQGT